MYRSDIYFDFDILFRIINFFRLKSDCQNAFLIFYFFSYKVIQIYPKGKRLSLSKLTCSTFKNRTSTWISHEGQDIIYDRRDTLRCICNLCETEIGDFCKNCLFQLTVIQGK